ncbi:MAG: Mor transcription activator family protein [Solidesulfovibrio sp. DCME]|uniref:Mor transcription activator family protein n=1 Tax=Solidesulfovibrio sp. DCME TaxID=3447380 RepID=UPI003D0CE078
MNSTPTPAELGRDDFLNTVTPDDLEGDIALVAEQCGIDVAVILVMKVGGTQLSVPRYALKRAAVRYIRAHYDGTNAKILALATGMTERFVYDAVASAPVKNDQYRLV